MIDVKPQVIGIFEDLYAAQVVDELATAAAHYLDRVSNYGHMTKYRVPSSLHDYTSAREMSNTVVDAPEDFDSDILRNLGVLSDGELKGAFNHIIARMITIPRMLPGYVDNWPTAEEKALYTDPPLLQMERDDVVRIHDQYFAQAAEKLAEEGALAHKFRSLGELAEKVCEIESVYPGTSSTEAYEDFGIFHLFPNNKRVDLTSTSPGVILPTEADPLAYKDSVAILKKNLMRPTYFDMLRLSVDSHLGMNRKRRYFASREGTRKNLLAYPDLIGAAKEILERYLALGKGIFEIRIGEPLPEMRHATLIGDLGVVYSVRDKNQKGKIAHNLTVMDQKEAGEWRELFNEQWATGEPMSIEMIDKLVA